MRLAAQPPASARPPVALPEPAGRPALAAWLPRPPPPRPTQTPAPPAPTACARGRLVGDKATRCAPRGREVPSAAPLGWQLSTPHNTRQAREAGAAAGRTQSLRAACAAWRLAAPMLPAQKRSTRTLEGCPPCSARSPCLGIPLFAPAHLSGCSVPTRRLCRCCTHHSARPAQRPLSGKGPARLPPRPLCSASWRQRSSQGRRCGSKSNLGAGRGGTARGPEKPPSTRRGTRGRARQPSLGAQGGGCTAPKPRCPALWRSSGPARGPLWQGSRPVARPPLAASAPAGLTHPSARRRASRECESVRLPCRLRHWCRRSSTHRASPWLPAQPLGTLQCPCSCGPGTAGQTGDCWQRLDSRAWL